MTICGIIKAIQILPVKLLVTILELTLDRLEVYSVSEMASIEGKSRNGILKSNRYKKIKIGERTTLSIKGIKNDGDDFPF